jgi:citronellol/citronellal dehydrogenase
VREEASVMSAVEQTVAKFGGIDICVNNASAISLTGTLATDMKRYDLMNQINARGTYLTSKACIPHLKRAANPHVLMLSPPLDMNAKWFAGHTAYSMAKFGMSMCVLGMAEEFRPDGVAFNALWPRTGIATAAIKFALAGDEGLRHCRTVEIMADAAHAIFEKKAREFTGNFLIDDSFLYGEGVRDFEQYRVDPTQTLMPDFFVPDSSQPPPGVVIGEGSLAPQ